MHDVRAYTAADREVWDGFITASKNGTFLFLRDYMEYHADRFEDASALAIDRQGTPSALFPASRSGTQLVSHGGLSYGGMISDRRMTTALALDVFSRWLAFCRSIGIREIVYKAVPPIYHRCPADEDRYVLFQHGADLYRREVLSVVDLADRLPMQERRQRGVRKALRSGLLVREATGFDGFWTILERNLALRHDVRPVHTAIEMQRLQGLFPQNIRLFGVFSGWRLCAGTVLYCALPTIHAQYIAADSAAMKAGALDLLFSTLIEENPWQARYFDFGNSNEQDGKILNRGLAEFKESFGARAICHDFYRLNI